MRVVAGVAKGRRLKPVPGEGTRPIMDRVKVALFDTLGECVTNSLFLDLFAGTGSVGIEALSRGARQAWFIDSNPRAIATIKENLAATGLTQRAEVRRSDAFRFLRQFRGHRFDVVYVAPPQYQGLVPRVLLLLDELDLVADSGLVICQLDPREYVDVPLEHFEIVDRRKYGSTLLVFYQRRPRLCGRAESDGDQ